MKKLIILTIISLFAYMAKAQTFDYQVKGWQLQVDTSYNEGDLPEEPGTRYWDENDLTTSLVLTNGVVLQDGHELFFDVLNQTGGTLTNGKVVAFAGSVGASGKIKAEYGIADYSIMQPKYIIGIVTHDILNGDQGKVTWFGKVRGIQTNGANYSETWVDGDILYVSPDSYGALTKVQPQAPYPAIPVAAVIKAHATMGTLLVRPTFPIRMQDLADVNGTPLTTKGQIPVWNQDNKYFDFDYNIWPDLISDEGYGSSWNGIDSVAPSKNAIYDKLQTMEPVSYCPATMTVNRGTLVSGTAADLCGVGGTDVQITELNGTDPLRVTFTFSGVTKISTFVFYGDYNGGAAHIVWAEIYNYNTSAWDYLGEFMTSPSKAWYSFPIYNSLAYISSGAVQVRLNHQGTGVSSHNLYLDYLDVNFGGGGTAGATNLSYTASPTDGKVNSDTGTDATIPAGSTTNASLMLPVDKTKLNGIASGADNYGSWTLNGGGTPTTVPSNYTVNFLAGTGLSVTNSGLDLTYTNTAPMTYPGAGLAKSTGSGWTTSLTDNSAVWNKAIYSDATFSAANYLLKTADTGRKAVASGITVDVSNNIVTSGTIQSLSGKFTNLTDGYIPYHISDASGLSNSLIYINSGNYGFNTTIPKRKFDLRGGTLILDNWTVMSGEGFVDTGMLGILYDRNELTNCAFRGDISITFTNGGSITNTAANKNLLVDASGAFMNIDNLTATSIVEIKCTLPALVNNYGRGRWIPFVQSRIAASVGGSSTFPRSIVVEVSNDDITYYKPSNGSWTTSDFISSSVQGLWMGIEEIPNSPSNLPGFQWKYAKFTLSDFNIGTTSTSFWLSEIGIRHISAPSCRQFISTVGNGTIYGKLGVQQTNPTASLHLPAGTATASAAPLKFTSGTNLTNPEAGAMEFDGSRLYFTPSTTRKTLSFDENIKTINGNSLIGTGDLTITASQVYPGAGLAKSTGSGWATSITDNSANWNTAYGWGNHASQGYVNSILINGTSGENAGGFLDFIPGSGINITKTGGHVTIAATVGSMVYPGAGIPVSTGSAWGTSITDNSSNWNTAYSNRIATFTTTGNSGAATFSGNTLNIPNYTLAGLGGQPKPSTTYLHFGTSAGWSAFDGSIDRYASYVLQRIATDGGGAFVGSTFQAATTTEAGMMSATDKTNLDAFTSNKSNYDAAYGNMGKVKLFGTSTYGELSASFFEWNTNSIQPIRDGSPQENSLYPITSGGVYTALLAKANLSGASFTGAISSTSTMTATDFILSSDRRLKTKIRPLNNTSWVRNIPLVSYQFKSDSLDVTRYGVIAQDVQTVNKHLVHKDEKGNLSVSYIDLLIAKIADLEKRVSDLETQVKAKK